MNDINELLISLKNNDVKMKKIVNKIIINSELTEEFLLENIKTYKDVCYYLNKPIETLPYLQIKQIEKLFNGNWVKDFSNNQQNWYPYFGYNKNSGFLVFSYSDYLNSVSNGQVAFYKSEIISSFIGKTFIDIYNKL